MSLSEVQLGGFCTCQTYHLDDDSIDYFLNTVFKMSQEALKNSSLENVKEFVVPTHLGDFQVENVSTKYLYILNYSPINVKKKIQFLEKNIDITPEINGYLQEIMEKADKLLEEKDTPKFNSMFLSIRVDAEEGRFNRDVIKQSWESENLRNIFLDQEKYLSDGKKGFICSTLFYRDSYKIISDILPRTLPLPKDVESQVGETMIKGFNLGFKESKMGLETLNISLSDSWWRLSIKVNFVLEKLKNIFPESLDLLESLSSLFLEEEK